MKYAVRAIKYFIYISVLVTLILVILAAAGVVSSDINVMFINGWKSVGTIAAVFAIFSAFYPLMGYTKRLATVLGEQSELKQGVVEYMEDHGYRLESEVDGTMKFRSKSLVTRILRTFEDTITIEGGLGGFQVEGLAREVTRIVSGLEYKFRNPDIPES